MVETSDTINMHPKKAPSSRGLGHRPFKPKTGIRIPLEPPLYREEALYGLFYTSSEPVIITGPIERRLVDEIAPGNGILPDQQFKPGEISYG